MSFRQRQKTGTQYFRSAVQFISTRSGASAPARHRGSYAAHARPAPLCLVTLVLLSDGSVSAQNAPSFRKLIHKVTSKYPRELKQNEAGGLVRLSFLLARTARWRPISTIGGHPVLVDAAIVAVKLWKYVPTDHTTTIEVRLDFVPR